MLTGDNERTARAVAQKLTIDVVITDVPPEDKTAVVERLKADGEIVSVIANALRLRGTGL